MQLIALTLLILLAHCCSQYCPNSFTFNSELNICYFYSTAQDYNAGAMATCEMMGGWLMIADSYNKTELVMKLAALDGSSWIGLHYNTTANGYMWDNAIALNYTNWCPHDHPASKEPCVVVYQPDGYWCPHGGWENRVCDMDLLTFTCEAAPADIQPSAMPTLYPPTLVPSAPTAIPTEIPTRAPTESPSIPPPTVTPTIYAQYCPEPFLFEQTLQICYYYHNAQLSNADAMAYCESLNGGWLIATDSYAKTQFVENLAAEDGDSWIGLHYNATAGGYVLWDSGEAVMYVDWCVEDDPHSSEGCAVVYQPDDWCPTGGWENRVCDVDLLTFTCEVKPSILPPSPAPTAVPSRTSSDAPTAVPTVPPSAAPSTTTPSARPSITPTTVPSARSTTSAPSSAPSETPSYSTAAPSTATSAFPSVQPSPVAPATLVPSVGPSQAPISLAPTVTPTASPSTSDFPTVAPTAPTAAPSAADSQTPSVLPTMAPTPEAAVTLSPTATRDPSSQPTVAASGSTSSGNAECPGSFFLSAVDSSLCLNHQSEAEAYDTAANYCSDRGSHLIKIADAATNSYLLSISSSDQWLGLSYNDDTNTYQWEDGTAADAYSTWCTAAGSFACVIMVQSDRNGCPAGSWMTADCTTEAYSFTCEIATLSSTTTDSGGDSASTSSPLAGSAIGAIAAVAVVAVVGVSAVIYFKCYSRSSPCVTRNTYAELDKGGATSLLHTQHHDHHPHPHQHQQKHRDFVSGEAGRTESLINVLVAEEEGGEVGEEEP